MKRTLIPVLILLLLLAGCQQEPSLPKTTAAAWEVYQHYADREDVTVAFIGDYATDSGSYTYDLVMFQADDSISFAQIRKDFGLLTSEEIGRWNDTRGNIIDSIRSGVKSILDTIKEAYRHSNTPENDKTPYSTQNTNRDVDSTIGKDTIEMVLSHVNDDDVLDFILEVCDKYTPMYYGTLTDHEKNILWVFFFDTKDNYNNMMKKIIEDDSIIHK